MNLGGRVIVGIGSLLCWAERLRHVPQVHSDTCPCGGPSAHRIHEHVVNVILEDFVRACDPVEVNIEGDFNVRGNIKTVVRAGYKKQ